MPNIMKQSVPEADAALVSTAEQVTNLNGKAENMKSSLLTRVVLIWVCFMPVAILNGVIREKWYRPIVGELRAHQISTALASGAFFSWAFFMLRKQVPHLDRMRRLLIG